MTIVRRGYLNIGDSGSPCRVHYYSCGQGPAVIMLHPSPASGAVFLPVIERVAEHATVFALDTPGYGWSEGLSADGDGLVPYVDALDRFRDRLGLDEITLYGSATGSQIALEYARRYPGRCPSIVLDNIADFHPDEREAMTDGYFPDLSVDFGGGHLARIWTMSLDLLRFFPWHWHDVADARLTARAIDADVVQAIALQYLQAGDRYHRAYRAAFVNEHAERLNTIETRTTVIRSKGSIVSKYADRFDRYEWPDHIRMHACGADVPARQQAVVDTIAERVSGRPAVGTLPQPVAEGLHMHRHRLGDVSTFISPRRGDDWLIVHDIGRSSTAVADTVAAFAAEHRVLTLDLPGHGASDELGCTRSGFINTTVALLAELLDAYGMRQVRVLAVGASAVLAARFVSEHRERVASVLLLDPVLEAAPFMIEPSPDGVHLLRLWHELRNAELHWPRDVLDESSALPGTPDLDCGRINQALLDALLSRSVYAQACAELRGLDDARALFDAMPCLVGRTVGTTSASRSLASFGEDLVADTVDLSGTPADWLRDLSKRAGT